VTKVPLRRDGAHKPDTVVEVELERLPQMPIAQLRDRYRDLFKAEPPKVFGPDLLRRSIAYRIQEKAYGGLARPTRRLLDHLIKAMAAKPNGRIELPRRIKTGAVLAREWKGTSHRVTVAPDGFAYQGTTYASLSEIACLITGTKWNGPKFFGLRPSSKADPTPGRSDGTGSTAPRRGRGRLRKLTVDASQTDAGAAP
jgi:hypothetical protein